MNSFSKLASSNTIVIISGPPGSGKSTIAENFCLFMKKCFKICEADNYFTIGGKYCFNPNELQEAHQNCVNQVIRSCQEGIERVIVANTFTKAWEFVPYAMIARRFGYEIVHISLWDTNLSAKQLAKRCVHNVPEDVIEKKLKERDSVKTGLVDPSELLKVEIPKYQKQYFNSILKELGQPDGVVVKDGNISYIIPKDGNLMDSIRKAILTLTTWDPVLLQKYLTKRRERDGNQFHITIGRSEEEKKLANAIREANLDNSDFVFEGIGCISENDNECYYIIVSCEKLNNIYDSAGVKRRSLHITLGFKEKDIHKPKGIDTKICDINPNAITDVERHLVEVLLCPHAVITKCKTTNGISAFDVKVKSKGGDDVIYTLYPELVQLIPRGLVFVSTSEGWLRFEGNKKFTGLGLDDDDDQSANSDQAQKIREKMDQAEKVCIQGKANGHCGHLAVFRIGKTVYLLCGSKLSHIIVRLDETMDDIAKYVNTDYHSYKNLMALFEVYDKQTLNNLFGYLEETGGVLCYEVEDPNDQHIVLLEKTDVICFNIQIPGENCLHPQETINKLRELGMHTVPSRTCNINDFNMDEVRSQENTEGWVVYFMDNVGVNLMLKVKSNWYVFQRAIREVIRAELKDGVLAKKIKETEDKIEMLVRNQNRCKSERGKRRIDEKIQEVQTSLDELNGKVIPDDNRLRRRFEGRGFSHQGSGEEFDEKINLWFRKGLKMIELINNHQIDTENLFRHWGVWWKVVEENMTNA